MKPRYIIIFLTIFLFSSCANSLFYYPDKRFYNSPTEESYDFEDVNFKSKDGILLNGWFIKSIGPPKGTIIHFHGNAQNMTAHYSFVKWIPKHGFNLFLFDYRGYGKSAGKPERKGIYNDCISAVDYICSREDIDITRLFLLGQSIGGAHAISIMDSEIAENIKAVAVDSAFYSYREITRDKLKLFPIISLINKPLSYLMVSNEKSPEYSIKKIKIPILIIHGKKDRIVPFRHGQLIYNNAVTEKKFIAIDTGRHTDAFIKHDEKYREKLLTFFLNAVR